MKNYWDFTSAPSHQIALSTRSPWILIGLLIVIRDLLAVVGEEGLLAIGADFR